MIDIWSTNIASCLDIVRRNTGPDLVTIVSGSEIDKCYWQEYAERTCRDVFRSDGGTDIISVAEMNRKGNFLGTINAWRYTKQATLTNRRELPHISLIAMVFGQGKRLSPFTQTLGNRKPAFPTPYLAKHAKNYLSMSDMSNLCSNVLVQYLNESGFRGCLVKWGDEAIVSGVTWNARKNMYADVDVVRSVFKTEITEDLAREKEWIVIDKQKGLMHFQYARQHIDSLRARMAELDQGTYDTGVNLGNLALSYDFMNVAADVFGADIADSRKWVDWDPYVWIALFCRDRSQWQAEIDHEDRYGRNGIRQLEARYPDFYERIAMLRSMLEAKKGRPLSVAVLDFGQVLWTDFGLHLSLRRSLESLLTDSERGTLSRELFGIPHQRDSNGNIILRSHVPDSAAIRGSIIIDTVIRDPHSIIDRGVVIGGRHRRLTMPYGGCALFCAADQLTFTGPHAVAFRSLGREITLPEGGRHTSLLLPDRIEAMISNEAVVDYDGEHYSRPMFENRLSFEEAGAIMASQDGRAIDARWFQLWQRWLDQ